MRAFGARASFREEAPFAVRARATDPWGVTLSPLRLDLAPTGLRLLVRVSGLKPDTSLFSLTHYATHYATTSSAVHPATATASPVQGVRDGTPMYLRGPEGQTLLPGEVAIVRQGIAGIPRADETLGPSGSTEIAFLFFTPLHAMHGMAQVVIEHVRRSSIAAEPSTLCTVVSGSWRFSVALL